MLKKEILTIFYSKKTIILICVLFTIPIIDLGLFIYTSRLYDFFLHPESYDGSIDPSLLTHPTRAAFLSAASRGHLVQMVYIWLLPIFLLNLYSDHSISENLKGYTNIITTRIKKSTYIKAKFLVSFLFSFILVFTSMMLNYVVSILIFKGGQDFSGLDLLLGDSSLYTFSFNYPYLTYFIFILIFSISSGLCGIICQGFSLLLKSYKHSYFASFFTWIILIVMPPSITYLFQPYQEYGFNYMIPAALILIFVTLVILIYSYKESVCVDEYK